MLIADLKTIMPEAEKLGFPVVKEEDMAVVRESAARFGVQEVI